MRRFLTLLSCFCLLFLESTEVFASTGSVKENKVYLTQAMLQEPDVFEEIIEQDNEQLFAKYANIIDVEVIDCNEEMLDMVDVRIDNGMKQLNRTSLSNEFEVEKSASLKRVTLAKDVSNESESQDVSTYYVMSASGTVKTSSGEITESGVKITGNIVWEDTFGPFNTFIHCSGNRTGAYGSNNKAFYTTYTSDNRELCRGFFDQGFVGTSDSSNVTGKQFILKVSSGAEGIMGSIELYVKTSIFD